jgi:diguanylate cyclase (GGDEF)-like protein/PAS domain S-box-containing protein
MILTNPDCTIVMANKAFCGLLGYSEQELVGQSIADITCEEDIEKSKELLGQLFANSIPVFRLEKRYVRKDGGIVWANITASAIHGKEGNVLYGMVIIEDLTESRKAAEKIRLLAYYDSLTGLPNRTFHKELMIRAIEHAERRKEIFALIYIGLDNFQRINDSLGHSIGDLLLKAVADRLTNSLRKSDLVARSDKGETVSVVSRVGGDEFIVLAHDINQAQDAAKTSRRLLEEMSAPYDISGREVFLTVSIGIALYPDDGTDVDDLLKNAEKAMRHTKSEGKNNFHFYSSSMHTSVLAVLIMESDLHKALERNEFVLYYQPQVDTATRMVKGMEALIRWIHPDKGMIPPMQFIPLAETSGLIIPIGEFVIRTVCRQIKTWQEAGYKQINISLNVSGRQFDQQNLIEIVKDALQDTMISPQCLELEITESTIMRNPEKALRILTELKAMGIGISIDDFGTGYSSLSYLKRLPLDFLKIDQSFVKSLASDSRDQAIVRATIAMAHSLNLKTIAEGVETQEQLSFLQEHGCDEIQGYLFSRPLPAEDIPGILAKGYL